MPGTSQRVPVIERRVRTMHDRAKGQHLPVPESLGGTWVCHRCAKPLRRYTDREGTVRLRHNWRYQ